MDAFEIDQFTLASADMIQIIAISVNLVMFACANVLIKYKETHGEQASKSTLATSQSPIQGR